MTFNLGFKGVHYHFEISGNSVKINTDKNAVIIIGGKQIKMKKGEEINIIADE
jgi:hypothetical protein